jgi:N6-L-threonylcarbamoyladenine synthase
LSGDNDLRSTIISSSLAQHQAFGGVVPEIASRHTLENIDTVFQEALVKAGITPRDIDLVSVTYGPGLIGSLLVGVSFAKALAASLNVPLIGVNHLHAHVFASFLDEPFPDKPFMGLVVSGGHTSIVEYRDEKFHELAATRDDACGEAFDKVAKILGLGYPGGPVIDRLSRTGKTTALRFKCGSFKNSYDFSFSGIKTAVLYYVQKCVDLEKEIPDICAAFQKSVIDDIVSKTLALTVKKRHDLLVVGGGVSANSYLREHLTREAEKRRVRVLFPQFQHSLDNGAMVARYGYHLFQKGHRSKGSLAAVPSLGFA